MAVLGGPEGAAVSTLALGAAAASPPALGATTEGLGASEGAEDPSEALATIRPAMPIS